MEYEEIEEILLKLPKIFPPHDFTKNVINKIESIKLHSNKRWILGGIAVVFVLLGITGGIIIKGRTKKLKAA